MAFVFVRFCEMLSAFGDQFSQIIFFLIFLLFLDTIWIGSGTKNPKILLDQNEFTINTKLGNRTRWRCNQYFKSKCKATLITYERTVLVKNIHNHIPTNPSIENSVPKKVTISRQAEDPTMFRFGLKMNRDNEFCYSFQ